MKHSSPFVAVALLGSSLCFGCNGDRSGNSDDEGQGGAGSVEPDIDDSSTSALKLSDADLLFEAKEVPVFELTLPPEDWEKLQKEALKEEYVEANLNFEGANMGSVGLRFKGSWGSLSLCLDEEGNLLCQKLSMKIGFSEIYKDKRFYGLKRLNFHAMAGDASKLNEKLSYKLYRDMGVEAPRSNWAVLKINGESLGIYSLVEQIDGRFTDNRWPDDGDGNLYKETWPLTTDEEWYSFGLKTNEETADHTQIVDFYKDMAAADEEDLLDTLKRWTDRDQLATYMAVDDAISNWDGVTAWYDWGEEWAPHNLFWYQHKLGKAFTLIPWDLDNTLSTSIPTGEVPHWTTTPDDCEKIYTIWGNAQVKAPGCTPIFQALASDRRAYEDAIDLLLDGPFDLELLSDQIDSYVAMIRDEVEADPTGSGGEGWEYAVADLKNNLALHRLKLEALRAQQELATSTLSVNRVNDFETLQPYSVILGIEAYRNSNSSTSRSVNDQSPLFGEQDIKLDFSFRDEPSVQWGQWGSFIFQIKEGVVDVRKLQGIRLHLRSDSASRVVRIGIESHANSHANEGVSFGWMVEATDSLAEIELLFSEAEPPSWAAPNDDVLEDVLAIVHGITIQPQVVENSGYLGEGIVDEGSVQVDNIEFF